MTEVTRILNQIETGVPSAADQLLPLVYEELRKLAAAKMRQEKPGQTLDATGLVHEAYIRLVDSEKAQHWNSRGHFFGAAAKAMRRILIDKARRKAGAQHGGDRHRENIPMDDIASCESPAFVLAIDEALQKLTRENEVVAQLVELRYFAGLTVEEAAKTMKVSDRTARRYWVYAKAWLLEELGETDSIG